MRPQIRTDEGSYETGPPDDVEPAFEARRWRKQIPCRPSSHGNAPEKDAVASEEARRRGLTAHDPKRITQGRDADCQLGPRQYWVLRPRIGVVHEGLSSSVWWRRHARGTAKPPRR